MELTYRNDDIALQTLLQHLQLVRAGDDFWNGILGLCDERRCGENIDGGFVCGVCFEGEGRGGTR